MKYSVFNSMISLSEKTDLLYNSYSDSFLMINSGISKILRDNIDAIHGKFPELYDLLVMIKAYVDDNDDEFALLDSYSNSILDRKTDFFVIINPTLSCNFNCWYCYEHHLSSSKMPKDIMHRVFLLFDHIVSDFETLKSFPISFFGGEPLIYFNSIVLPIMEYHHNLCMRHNITASYSFTSNGALVSDNMILMLSNYNDVSFQITLDGGREEHNKVRIMNKGDSYGVIVNNVIKLLKNRIKVRLRINYTRKNLYSIKSVLNDLLCLSDKDRSLLKIDFHWIWQEKNLMEDLSGIRDVVEHFSNNGFSVIFNDIDSIRNSCYADRRNTAVINYNGDVFKCTSRDFVSENREGYLNDNGKIIWTRSQEYRHSLRLKNGLCRVCRIAPLCAGGCSQFKLSMEHDENYCMFYSDERKDSIILDRFNMLIVNKYYG